VIFPSFRSSAYRLVRDGGGVGPAAPAPLMRRRREIAAILFCFNIFKMYA
jgi:hypothetical protein